MENYEILKNLESFGNRINSLKTAINIEGLEEEIKEKEVLSASPSFYDNMKEAQNILKELKKLKDVLATIKELEQMNSDLEFYYEIQKNGEVTENENDKDVSSLIKDLEKMLSKFEEKMLLSGEYDDCDALFELHPGAGGTESQDWAEMLFRMYKRYADSHGYEFEVIDYLEGEEAGIKSVTFMMSGDKAYGYLKSEHGTHRLVRISPFDAGARRHTSFVGCTVTPVFTSEINLDIDPKDIRIDTYRSSGAGGQYVNTTDSAVRITHLKTGIVVTCQNQRNQIQNREKAMEILKSKLYKLQKEENERKVKDISGDNGINSFGGQIRSYVFHPYSMVKDHRTEYETGNVNAVMDGELDGFIDAYLKWNKVK